MINTNNINRIWSEDDKFHLWVLYKKGFPIKIIANVINRSENAVNGALKRFKIITKPRNKGIQLKHFKRENDTRDCINSFKINVFESFSSFNFKWEKMRAKKAPWYKNNPETRSENAHREKKENESIFYETYHKPETLISHCRSEGMRVRPLNKWCRFQKSQLFCVESTTISAGILVTKLNQCRVEKGERPLLFNDITER